MALIDDIASLLDDVALLSKVAVKKTAGVLGDDLALNANQVTGVRPEREIPVVWAVAKGSFVNKLILVPAALLISAFLPVLITVLLILGGLYLCYEGAEKVFHRFFLHQSPVERETRLKALADESIDIVALEKEKIKGAIRTDFILSAEIVVIALGSVTQADFITQVGVLSAVCITITIGVYGLVAAIVKMDDAGLYMLRKAVTGNWNGLQRMLGRGLLIAAPLLMKALGIIGTLAMFLVGGGILSHNITVLHHLSLAVQQAAPALSMFTSLLFDGLAGFIAGAIVVASWSLIGRWRKD
nr:DUF808 domain-containing protein [Rheinheimera hassiensis]